MNIYKIYLKVNAVIKKVYNKLFKKDDTRTTNIIQTRFLNNDLTIKIIEEDRANIVGNAGDGYLSIYVPLVTPVLGSGIIEVIVHELVHIEQMIRDGYIRYSINRTKKDKLVDYELEAYTTAIVNMRKLDKKYKDVVELIAEELCFSVEELKGLHKYNPDYAFILPHSIPNMSKEFYTVTNRELKNLYMIRYSPNKVTSKQLNKVARDYVKLIKEYSNV